MSDGYESVEVEAVPLNPFPAESAPSAPPSQQPTVQMQIPAVTLFIWGFLCVASLLALVAHVIGRGLNKKRADFVANSLRPLLRAQFAAPFSRGAAAGAPKKDTAPPSLTAVDRCSFEAWHTGRRGVRGLFTRLDTLPRAMPLYWAGVKVEGAPQDGAGERRWPTTI